MRSCFSAQEIGSDGDASFTQHLYAAPLVLGMRIDQRHVDRSDTPGDPPGESVNMLVQRVAGASLSEIDNVIGELRSVRDFLRNEGDRVQREIAGYATVSQTAMASMKVISESMAQWRNSVGAPLSPRD